MSTPHASAIVLVNAILANPDSIAISDDDAVVGNDLVQLAQYARALESQVAASGGAQAGSSNCKVRSAEEMIQAVEKVRKAAVAGIKKQMSWKPSCKTGSAKWVYDGVCADDYVFGALMGLDGPPTWKQKKLPLEQFENLFGSVGGSVRYDRLYMTSKFVNVKYPDGEFKLSGTYGKYQP